MTTHEHEITAPVDLCTPDGRHLNPAAAGWSRRPLHRANLAGWGRTKRWDYWGVVSGEAAVGLTFADIDYAGTVSLEWFRFHDGAHGGAVGLAPFGRGIRLPESPGTEPLTWHGRGLVAEVVDDPDGTTLTASWTEKGGEPARFEARVELPAGHESLNVVIPWSDKRFQYTSKHQARPAKGSLAIGDHTMPFDEKAWGVLDVGRGRWPYRARWNWGAGAGVSDEGPTVGLQIGGKWTVGTGFTENGIIVDGVLHKLGEELVWDYDWNRPMRPWHVTSPDGRLDLTLHVSYDRYNRAEAVVLATQGHQCFGVWEGEVVTDEGTSLHLHGAVGFAEDFRWRW